MLGHKFTPGLSTCPRKFHPNRQCHYVVEQYRECGLSPSVHEWSREREEKVRMKSKLLSQRQTDRYTGMALVGKLEPKDQLAVMEHLNELYFLLDEKDDEDFFGTEGWRHYFGLPE